MSILLNQTKSVHFISLIWIFRRKDWKNWTKM